MSLEPLVRLLAVMGGTEPAGPAGKAALRSKPLGAHGGRPVLQEAARPLLSAVSSFAFPAL